MIKAILIKGWLFLEKVVGFGLKITFLNVRFNGKWFLIRNTYCIELIKLLISDTNLYPVT